MSSSNKSILILTQMNGKEQNTSERRGCGEPELSPSRRNQNQTSQKQFPQSLEIQNYESSVPHQERPEAKSRVPWYTA